MAAMTNGAGRRQTGTPPAGTAVPPGGPWVPARLIRRRRPRGRVAAATALVVAGVAVGWLVAAKSAGRTPVLVTARAVPAGHVLAPADVRTVDLAGAEGLGAFAVTDTEKVVGRPAALPLPAGALLTPQVLGATWWPPAGQAVISVLVKPGAGPTVQAGQQVGLVILPDTTTTGSPAPANGSQAAPVTGVVTTAENAGQAAGAGSRVVTVLIARADAPALAAAAAAGRVALILLPAT